MPRSIRSREINIFNFSFLDILACTIGALAFILVMVLLQPPGRVNTVAMEESREKLSEEVNLLSSSLAKAVQASKGQEARLKELKNEIARMRARLRAVKKELKKDSSRNAAIARQIAVMTAQLQKKSKATEEITKRIYSLEQEVTDLPKHKKISVRFKIPRWHTMDKLEVYFECVSGSVNVLERTKLVKGPDGETKEIPIPDPTPIAQIKDENSHFAKRLARMDPENEYAFFFVRPDGFNSFRIAREILWKRGFEVGWIPWSSTKRITFGKEGEEPGAL